MNIGNNHWEHPYPRQMWARLQGQPDGRPDGGWAVGWDQMGDRKPDKRKGQMGVGRWGQMRGRGGVRSEWEPDWTQGWGQMGIRVRWGGVWFWYFTWYPISLSGTPPLSGIPFQIGGTSILTSHQSDLIFISVIISPGFPNRGSIYWAHHFPVQTLLLSEKCTKWMAVCVNLMCYGNTTKCKLQC